MPRTLEGNRGWDSRSPLEGFWKHPGRSPAGRAGQVARPSRAARRRRLPRAGAVAGAALGSHGRRQVPEPRAGSPQSRVDGGGSGGASRPPLPIPSVRGAGRVTGERISAGRDALAALGRPDLRRTSSGRPVASVRNPESEALWPRTERQRSWASRAYELVTSSGRGAESTLGSKVCCVCTEAGARCWGVLPDRLAGTRGISRPPQGLPQRGYWAG